eukprot:GILJ01027298.1.p1 GENE.GILJ01027298.1~~GILJ01027298.1.p1  ORF type:complete len:332 (+),score=69.71 GILJ01027298.1:134-1129(+)
MFGELKKSLQQARRRRSSIGPLMSETKAASSSPSFSPSHPSQPHPIQAKEGPKMMDAIKGAMAANKKASAPVKATAVYEKTRSARSLKYMTKEEDEDLKDVKKTEKKALVSMNTFTVRKSDEENNESKSFWEYLKEEHMLVGLWFKTKRNYSRSARVTGLVCMILGNLFVCGLFYQAPNDDCTEDCEDQGGEFGTFSLTEFITGIYAGLAVFPVTLLTAFLFQRQTIKAGTSMKKRIAIAKKNRIRMYFAYTVAFGVIVFTSWFIILFALSFNVQVSRKMFSAFAVSSGQQLLVIENLKVMIKVCMLWGLMGVKGMLCGSIVEVVFGLLGG